MTNTYKDDEPIDFQIKEELRCIRCVLERLLMRYGDYTDYQMEKFGKDFKLNTHKENENENATTKR